MAVAQCTFDWRIPSDSNSGFHQHIYSRYICLEIDVSATLFLLVRHVSREAHMHRYRHFLGPIWGGGGMRAALNRAREHDFMTLEKGPTVGGV